MFLVAALLGNPVKNKFIIFIQVPYIWPQPIHPVLTAIIQTLTLWDFGRTHLSISTETPEPYA